VIITGPACMVVFVDRDGREVVDSAPGAIELRSAGPGWRWVDIEGNEWGSASAPLEGESMPRWCKRWSREELQREISVWIERHQSQAEALLSLERQLVKERRDP